MKNIRYFLPLLALSSLMSCKSSNVQVKVTLNFNNCEPSKTILVNKGSLLKIDDPIKDRCNFLWWKLGDDKFDLTTPINNDITLDAHYEYDAENIFKDIEHAEVRHNNANLRVMSFNLLVSIYNNLPHHHGYNPINDPYPQGVDDGRDYQARDTIMHFLPDVVGLQECDQSSDDTEERQLEDNGWYDFFEDQHQNHDFPYVIVNNNDRTREVEEKKGPVDRTIFSTLMYNSDTVEPVGTFETTLSEYSDNNNCRWLTCCVFRKKDDGKEFIVTSTHWNLSGSPKEDRIAQARESADLTK